MPDDVGIGAVATWAAKALRPTRPHERFGAPALGADAAKELGERHAVLELNSIEGQGARSAVRRA